MAPDDDEFEDDLYDDEFDFVDDEDSDLDDDDSDVDSAVDEAGPVEADSEVEEDKPAPVEPVAKRPAVRQRRLDEDQDSRGEPRNEGPRDRGPRNQNSRDQDPRDRDDAPREFDRGDEVPPDEEPAEEIRQPEVPANYRVHVYEYGEFKRTIDRPFTAEDAEAFASEYNRTSKSYSRFAIAGKEDVKPKKLLEDAKSPG